MRGGKVRTRKRGKVTKYDESNHAPRKRQGREKNALRMFFYKCTVRAYCTVTHHNVATGYHTEQHAQLCNHASPLRFSAYQRNSHGEKSVEMEISKTP